MNHVTNLEARKLMSTICLDQYIYHFSIGAFGISFGLPAVCYLLTFLCNDLTGCPVPSALTPSTLTLDKLRYETGWPGISGLYSHKVTGMVLLYYLTSAALYRILPGHEVMGTRLANGGKLQYKLNSEHLMPILHSDLLDSLS